jgi:nucleotide-binding universal stress UspA family protein
MIVREASTNQSEETFVRAPLSPAISKILVAIDGSQHAIRAAHAAIRLAANFQAELIVLSVVPNPSLFVPTRVGHAPPPVSYVQYYDRMEKEASKCIDEIISLATGQGVKKATKEVLRSTGSVVETIIKNAEAEGVDLIVTGTRGMGGFKKLLMGSVSSGLVAHAHCSVLIVR